MAIEIERKFLVVGTKWRSVEGTRIWQGYLNRDKNRTVRVRVADADQLRALCDAFNRWQASAP